MSLRWRKNRAGPSRIRAYFEHLSIRAALFLGFALIFAIWLVSAYDLAHRIAAVGARAERITVRFMEGEQTLSELRADVLLTGLYLRDAVLDTDAETGGLYRQQMQQTRDSIDHILHERPPLIASAAERERWASLSGALKEYWDLILPVLEWDPSRRTSEGRAFLRHQVFPKRQIILRISGEIRGFNRQAFEERQSEVQRIYTDVQWRIWATSVLAVLLGLVIAVLVVRYAARLEERIQLELKRDQENRAKLQRLSARLVDAQEDERRHIARELHDEVGQMLSAIKMDLTSASRSTSAKTRDELMEEAHGLADRTLQSVRDLSHLLHPAMLDDLGLPDALKWYLRGFSRRTLIRTQLVANGLSARMPAPVETCAYRIIQEAMTNVAKHAGASVCHIYLQRLPHSLLVTVEDDGAGFDVGNLRQPGKHPGLGLIGIEERAASLGGTSRIESRPGQGTRVWVELPMIGPADGTGGESTEQPAPPSAEGRGV